MKKKDELELMVQPLPPEENQSDSIDHEQLLLLGTAASTARLALSRYVPLNDLRWSFEFTMVPGPDLPQ